MVNARTKVRMFGLLLLLLSPTFIVLSCTNTRAGSDRGRPSADPGIEARARARCIPDGELSKTLQLLSSSNGSDSERAQKVLINSAEESDDCRNQIVGALMKAMDKPQLDFTNDEAAYYLWRYGAEALGKLKAAESLDLLISHLDSSLSTFSTSMTHQPALRGVIKMGTIAIPKLNAVLKGNPDQKMRFYAVYCLASIGGPSAVSSLREALPSESNRCVSRLIRVSLESFDSKGQIVDRGEWFRGGMCDYRNSAVNQE